MKRVFAATYLLAIVTATQSDGQGAAPAAQAVAPAKAQASPAAAGKDANGQPITTQIFADDASFDTEKRIGVFTGHVRVFDPRFNIQSDKLTVFIHKEEGEGLEKAIAEGHVGVVRDKPDPKGGPPSKAIGLSDKAVYTSSDGNVVLTGSPRVQQGLDTHIATDPGTVMVLNQDGHLTTHGPSRTEIRQAANSDKNGKSSPSPTPESKEAMIARQCRHAAPESAAQTPQTNEQAEVLMTDDLVKIYGGRAVVNGIKLNVGQGEIVGLLGKNGAGKTTTFYMIVGLVRPNSGLVVFSGNDVTNYPMYKRARLGMGYLPQEESIFRKMTVEQNILAILETMPLNKKERRHRCDELLHQFGIDRIAKNTALTLSGGEKRRLTIARSLVTRPKLLMLDEPFSGVDPIAVYDVQQLVVNLRKSGLAILITDHNVRETLSIVDRAYLIDEGRVVSEGTKDFLINDPISRQLYLGERFQM